MSKVLIVVDMQSDFVDGSLGNAQAQAIVESVRQKILKYRNHDELIIFTRDTHQIDYLDTQEGRNLPVEHCIIGTSGWKIYDNLDNECVNCKYVNKPTFGWLTWNHTLLPIINEVDEIELCGLCTDICVVSNALILKASFPEIKITVDARCCAGVTEESHRAALLTMKMCQVNIIGE